ncbi:MAG: Histidine biosynthesis bifunctional protein HisB [Candidatus Woesearchaeota archaeon]|nr:Histidine biosynthesis bifunctional protein HisB [Candidatus Woesearchaeota archaeon]
MNKAIFLDRDGVINENASKIDSPKKLKIYPYAPKAIKKINDSGYLAILVTNQPEVAKGFFTYNDLMHVHAHLKKILAEHEAHLDGLYVCPHHPEKGWEGEVPELKFDCDCRKPKPGLLLRAIEDFDIDVDKSWIIGDSKTDIAAGKAAGVKTILVIDGGGCGSKQDKKTKVEPDFVKKNLKEAVDFILKQ